MTSNSRPNVHGMKSHCSNAETLNEATLEPDKSPGGLSRRSLFIATGVGAMGALTGSSPAVAGNISSRSKKQHNVADDSAASDVESGRSTTGNTQVRSRKRERIIVIGGGVAGVATAWLLDDAFDVTLLEKDDSLGGHARSITIDDFGEKGKKISPVAVDIGAQYFGRKSHPHYWVLVTKLLNVPTVALNASFTIFEREHNNSLFTSPRLPRRVGSMLNPKNIPSLDAMRAFTFEGLKFDDLRDDRTTVEEFVEGLDLLPRLRILPDMRTRLLYPFAAAMFGCSISDVKRMSARAMLTFMVKPRLTDPLSSTTYYNSVNGLQAVVNELQHTCKNSVFHTGAAAMRVIRKGNTYQVTDSKGRIHRGDHVVFALTPTGNRNLLSRIPKCDDLAVISDRFETFRSKVVIHRDPIYMPAHSSDWSMCNAEAAGDWGEMCMWLGAARPEKGFKHIYKSWVNNRDQEPKEVIASYEFEHTLTTPDFIAAQSELNKQQGRDNMWFAGSHMNGPQSQDTALLSAMHVADALVPNSAKLRQIRELTLLKKKD